LPDDGITLSHFVAASQSAAPLSSAEADNDGVDDVIPEPASLEDSYREAFMSHNDANAPANNLKFHLKTYGCQMNVSDSDIVRSILLSNEMEETQVEMEADVILTNTCAIRENAEQKIWNRLKQLKALDRKNPLKHQVAREENARATVKKKRVIGVLGCMAERLKEDMFREGTADLVVGPDAYRDLPRLIRMLQYGDAGSQEGVERAVNVQLSLDETYADVKPVRRPVNTSEGEADVSAFVSVMRGCNNMCSYCVVPFTRGRERSRGMASIVEEIRQLHWDEQIKEVVLLGQNVNSYHDKSDDAQQQNPSGDYQTSNDGFNNLFRLRGGAGYYFSDLVEAVSDISPELRVRFTSPHPKDYPVELLQLMAERHNVCNQLHMPAQSGSTSALKRMRRGYSREAYLELMDTVHTMIPDVALSSDFITGFCGETEEEHRDTLSLMGNVQYDMAFMFAYSMRGKTHAHRNLVDDVAHEVKMRRLTEVIDTFRNNVQQKNEQREIGRLRVVLVEGTSRRSDQQLNGRTDQNKRILFDHDPCFAEIPLVSLPDIPTNRGTGANDNQARVSLQAGDYAVVQVTEVRGHTLKGRAICRTSLQDFNEWGLIGDRATELSASMEMEHLLGRRQGVEEERVIA
jgi:MiaB/RimO family radical SAM methylthiotransferase